MPSFNQAPLQHNSEVSPQHIVKEKRFDAGLFSLGNMDHSSEYIAFSDAARKLLEDKDTPGREDWAASLVLGPDPIAKDIAYKILLQSDNMELLAGVITKTRDLRNHLISL